MDPQIRIHTKMSWIRNTAEEFKYWVIFGIHYWVPVGLASWVNQHDVLRLEVRMDEPQLLQLQQRRQHLYQGSLVI
jgi:hypothetical protein